MAERKGPNKTELLQIRYRNGVTFSCIRLVPDDIVTALPIQGYMKRMQEKPKVQENNPKITE